MLRQDELEGISTLAGGKGQTMFHSHPLINLPQTQLSVSVPFFQNLMWPHVFRCVKYTEETNPADIFIFDFWPSDLWENTFWLWQPWLSNTDGKLIREIIRTAIDPHFKTYLITTWITLKNFMLSERSKSQTTYCISPFIWNVQNRWIYTDR